MRKPPHEYALYRGDRFIDIGTVSYLSETYGYKKNTLKQLASPSHQNRGALDGIAMVRLDDDEEEPE